MARRHGGGWDRSASALPAMAEMTIMEGEDEEEEDISEEMDPAAARLVRSSAVQSMILETPSDKFEPDALMALLTDPYIAHTEGGGVALDPSALRKLLTTAAAVLAEMGSELSMSMREVQRDLGPTEATMKESLVEQGEHLDTLMGDMDEVEKRFNLVATRAVRIGDKMEKMECQRKQAAEAAELLEHFKTFGSLPEGFADDAESFARYSQLLPPVFANEELRADAAAVLAQLRAVIFELDAPSLQMAITNLQAYSDYVERELLELFERAAGRSPPEIDFMKECASVLYTLNEGEHLQGRYVFNVVCTKLGRGSAAGGGHDSLSDLFGRVVEVCSHEFVIIKNAFPLPLVPRLTRLLLERILNDPVYGVNSRVEAVLSPPPPLEPLSLPDYLNCLSMVEQQTRALFDLLQSPDFFGILEGPLPPQQQAGGEQDAGLSAVPPHSGSSNDAEGDGGGNGEDVNISEALGKYLSDQSRHMFIEHRSGYIAKESRFLVGNLLQHYERVWHSVLHVRVARHTVASLDGFPVILPDKVASYEVLLEGPLSRSSVSEALALSADTIQRCRNIVPDIDERERRVAGFWALTCRYLVDHLIIPALRSANHLLPRPVSSATSAAIKEMKGEAVLPPELFYSVVTSCSQGGRALQAHFNDIVVPGMDETPTHRTVARETRRTYMQKIETSAAWVLQRALELVVDYVRRQLGNRRARDDYSIKEDAPIEPTRTMKSVCSMLWEQYDIATQCLPDMDLGTMWSAVGLAVHRLFVSHLKRLKVTVLGAFVLTNDLALLQEVLERFGSDKIREALLQLRETINIFMVPPENLPGLMETGTLARMSRSELREYARCRSDFHVRVGVRSQWAKSLFGESNESGPGMAYVGPHASVGVEPEDDYGDGESSTGIEWDFNRTLSLKRSLGGIKNRLAAMPKGGRKNR